MDRWLAQIMHYWGQSKVVQEFIAAPESGIWECHLPSDVAVQRDAHPTDIERDPRQNWMPFSDTIMGLLEQGWAPARGQTLGRVEYSTDGGCQPTHFIELDKNPVDNIETGEDPNTVYYKQISLSDSKRWRHVRRRLVGIQTVNATHVHEGLDQTAHASDSGSGEPSGIRRVRVLRNKQHLRTGPNKSDPPHTPKRQLKMGEIVDVLDTACAFPTFTPLPTFHSVS